MAQDVMSKIMKLLERANHPATPPAEAALAAERAEALMAQHQIDRMDLKPEEKSKVIQDHWDLRTGDADSNFHWHIRSLMESVLKHCSIRIHPDTTYAKDDLGRPDYSTRRFTVVGFPEDMAYAEQIWYRVFQEFVRSLNPKWDSSKSLGENAYHYLRAGIKWSVIWRVAYDNQPETGYANSKTKRTVIIADPATTKYNSSLKQAVKEYMEENKLGEYSAHTQRHNTYRNSFVESYSSTIRNRLREIRSKAKDQVSDSDKYALALRTTEQQVDDEFYRLFPEFDPENQRRRREAERVERQRIWDAMSDAEKQAVLAAEAEREERYRKAQEKARRTHRNMRSTASTYDSAAYERGQQAANRVKLTIDAEVKETEREALN